MGSQLPADPGDAPGHPLLGRSRECEVVDAFLAEPVVGHAGLVVVGAAGIGKTTLLRWSVEQARGRGLTVLFAETAEAETRASFVTLVGLLEPVVDDVLADLP